jgi:hypothetical protein
MDSRVLCVMSNTFIGRSRNPVTTSIVPLCGWHRLVPVSTLTYSAPRTLIIIILISCNSFSRLQDFQLFSTMVILRCINCLSQFLSHLNTIVIPKQPSKVTATTTDSSLKVGIYGTKNKQWCKTPISTMLFVKNKNGEDKEFTTTMPLSHS